MEIVKSRLYGNKDTIIDLLSQYGYCNFTGNDKILAFAYENDGSAGSCKLSLDSLQFKRWSTNQSGSIIDAVMIKTGLEFPQAIKDMKSRLGISNDVVVGKIDKVERSLMFGGMFDSISELKGEAVYGSYDVGKFDPIISTMLRNDGINLVTQHVYDVRYDKKTDRVVFLWKNSDGEVVGCNARANWDMKTGYQFKYLCLLPFCKGKHLFSFYENKEYISSSKMCLICESEKSSMQAHSFGFREIVSLGSSTVKREQMDILYNSGVRTFILGYDEGVTYLQYVNVAVDLYNWYDDIKVMALYDKENKFLKKGSKDSPTDNGREILENLFRMCLTRIDRI